ncbi:hypothetical protein [Corynebacterium liangguodongii]|nr:hypothetical protein [Corynebacterium liangguodongii]
MGLLESLRGLLGRNKRYDQAQASRLEVHTANLSPDTAELLVVITLDADSFNRLRRIDAPLRLSPTTGRAVTFVPVGDAKDPALDPNLGWIIPVTRGSLDKLRTLPATPGSYEIDGTHLAFVVTA